MLRHLLCLAAFCGLSFTLPTANADYPERNILAVIPWGAGGATDTIMRKLTPEVEKALGGKIVLMNRRGDSAVTGSRQVLKQAADGYSLLLGAENPQLYKALGLADFDYSDFTPICIIGQNVAVIATYADSPFNSMTDLLAAAHAKPGSLRMGSAGAGALPGTVYAMLAAVTDLQVEQVKFDGDGPGINALVGKRIDFMPLSLSGARDRIAKGELKALAVINAEPLAELLASSRSPRPCRRLASTCPGARSGACSYARKHPSRSSSACETLMPRP